MHREPDVGFDPGSPGSCPGPKAGAKPLRHPGIPSYSIFNIGLTRFYFFYFYSKGFSSFLLCSFYSPATILIIIVLNSGSGDTWVAQWLSTCLWFRLRSWSPGIESHIGVPMGSLLLPLPMSLPLCLS